MAKVIRYIGRESHFKGKTIFEIAANLKSCKGRVVYRTKWAASTNPAKTYVILEDVKPDLSKENFKGGTATGYRVHRGHTFDKIFQIDSGMKQDWHLVPREDEESFCKIDHKLQVVDNRPKVMKLPPVMVAKLKTFETEKSQLTEIPIKYKKKSGRKLL
ncbi:small ribosomal subunit protein mS34-like [Ylistrum balloti]|uniref:small ribosomal subunit protein mS34-like n=1 Tax=Ylistrum balloti TaxID=509963 RepID=UPI0029058157|nr:small ribosomal subunit protein mS34-like [Ylistrum balloti]